MRAADLHVHYRSPSLLMKDGNARIVEFSGDDVLIIQIIAIY
jgi:hypothetical protein